jgi:hypothetical protein
MPYSGSLTASPLPDGRILVIGGNISGTYAELYDPLADSWSITASPLNQGDGLQAITLQSGKVLAVGGIDASGTHTTAELYDPGNSTWSMTGSMTGLRADFGMTLLQSGGVLAAGGTISPKFVAVLSTAELYDPSAGTWSATGSMYDGRVRPTATLLTNGNVLVVGGDDWSKPLDLVPSAEIYETNQGQWIRVASPSLARFRHTATLLKDGRVLITGGDDYSVASRALPAEIYDPAHGTWTNTGPMTIVRSDHTATLQPDGTVLVVGGTNYGTGYPVPLASAEIYDPTTNTWTPTGDLSSPRAEHVAVALPSGKTLVIGGQNFGYGPSLTFGEIYGFDVPPATLTATPTGSPMVTATATLATPKPTADPAPTSTPILLTLAPVPASIPLTVRLSSTTISAGDVLVVTVRTAPMARVAITLLALPNRTGRTGAAFYRMTVHGRAGIHGRYIARLKSAFRPSLAVLANLNVEARTPDGSARRTLRVVLQPVARRR